jgi:hypothetical protein
MTQVNIHSPVSSMADHVQIGAIISQWPSISQASISVFARPGIISDQVCVDVVMEEMLAPRAS